jgi:hypothetical protein
MANARESRLDQLRRRQKESKENAGKSPFSYDRFFEVPDNIPLWNPKGDEKGKAHYIDLLPFIMGDKVPTNIPSQKTQPGEWDYKLEVFIHRNVGTNDKVVLCPYGNFGLPCPICEHARDLLADTTDDDERKAIKQEKYPKRYVLYNVWVHDDTAEEEKGVQIWSVPHFFFEDKIKDLESEDGSEVIIGDISNDFGRQIKFIIEKKGKSNTEYKGHSFKKRVGYEIPANFGEEGAYQLDSFLKPLLSYDDLSDMYWGRENKKQDKDEQDEAPTRRTLNTQKQEPKETKEDKPLTLRTLNRQTENAPETSGKEEAKDTSESAPESAPENKSSERSEAPESNGPEDEITSCPKNHTFGTDCLKKPECNDCDNKTYRACQAMKKKLKGK